MEGQVLNRGFFNGKYKRIYTFGDGSCFFHAIAILINGDYTLLSKKEKIQYGHDLRAKIMDKDLYTQFLKQTGFVNLCVSPSDSLKSHVQADEAIINFTANRLNINIIILVSPTEKYIREVDASQPYMLIAWLNRSHFEPITYLKKSTFAYQCGIPEIEVEKHHYLIDSNDPILSHLKK